jgi:glycosyltransferase involved in cell wall biosynthesis/CelD/BcsL family acetyltransferase involved in cellulose biosynthesis
MNNGAVSVIIPAYRAASTIGRAIDSVLAQSRPAAEIIVVDDGSPEDIEAAIARFQKRVTYVKKPNGGAASARNAGIARAAGDVVTFLDADDYWEPNKIARQIDHLERHPEVGMVGSWLYLQQPGGPRRPDPAIDPTYFDKVLRLHGPDAFHAAGMFWTGTVAIRRDVLGEARFDESLTTAEDRELWLRLLLRAPAYLSGEALATCVLEAGSLSRGNVERDCRNMLAVIERYKDMLGPDAYRHWKSDVHRRWSTRLLADGDPRGALRPALTHLRETPSARALWTAAKSAALGARMYAPSLRAERQGITPAVASTSLKVAAVTTVDGFAALRDEWTALQAESNVQLPALTWDWLFTWWETFAEGRELLILTARNAGGKLVGIAPLVRRTIRPRGVPIRRVELLATGEDEADEILSEYLDFIIARGRERDCTAAFFAHLAAQDDWDELCFASVPADSPLVASFRDAVARTGAPIDITTKDRPDGIIVSLAPDAPKFVAAQGKRMREDLRRHRRLLEQHGKVTLRRAETAEDLAQMFPELMRLHQALWTSRGKPGCFASARFTLFHQKVSARMLARGLLHLHTVTVGEKVVAARYGFHLNHRLYEYQSGNDPTFDPKVSLGVQAAQLCMEDAIGRGFVEYDLGEGPRPYKLRWNHVRRTTQNVWITRRNARTLAHALAGEGETQLRALKRAVDAKRGKQAAEPAKPATAGDD